MGLDVGAYGNDITELRAPGFERPRKNADYQQLKLQATQGENHLQAILAKCYYYIRLKLLKLLGN